jgi:hypothetical protein
LGRKKSQAESIVVYKKPADADLNLLKNACAIAITAKSQCAFKSAKQNQRYDNHRDEAKKPFAARSWRINQPTVASRIGRVGELRLTLGF